MEIQYVHWRRCSRSEADKRAAGPCFPPIEASDQADSPLRLRKFHSSPPCQFVGRSSLETVAEESTLLQQTTSKVANYAGLVPVAAYASPTLNSPTGTTWSNHHLTGKIIKVRATTNFLLQMLLPVLLTVASIIEAAWFLFEYYLRAAYNYLRTSFVHR